MDFAAFTQIFYLAFGGELRHLVRDVEAVGLALRAATQKSVSQDLLHDSASFVDSGAVALAIVEEPAVS